MLTPLLLNTCADPEGDRGSGPPLLKKHKNIGFPSNIGQDPIKINTATKPTFNVGPSSARQRNAILSAGVSLVGR